VYWLNGSKVASNQAGMASPGRLGLVGGGQFSSEQSKADIGQVIIYDNELSEEQIAEVYRYLSLKFGVAVKSWAQQDQAYFN